MFNQKTIKSPSNSRRKFNKNFSFDSFDSNDSGRTIYKLHDRLFNSEIISNISKNDSNYSRNLLNIKKKKTTNNYILKQIKNFSFKSFDKRAYLNLSPKKKIKNKNSTLFSKDEENTDKNKPRISFIYHRDKELNRRDSIVFLNKSTLSSRGGPRNKNKYMLVNQIIKFNIMRKNKEKKGLLLPMKLGKDYTDFIEKKNKFRYNPNFNSPYIHRMNSNYLLDHIFKYSSKPKIPIKLKKRKKTEEEEEKEQLELEQKDKIEEMSVDLQYYKKAIKIFLSNETKLNQINFHEEFFDSFVNQINFLFDDRKFPTIKNNLHKIIIELNATNGYEWNRLNMIEISTLTYLHKLKAKIQRELDEIKEENKEKQFKINQQIGKYNNNKKKKKRNNINKSIDNEKTVKSENNIDNNLNNNTDKTSENKEEEDEELLFNKEDLYELEEFFTHKGKSNIRIPFASGKVADVVYHNPDFYKINFGKFKLKKSKANKKKVI